MCDEVVFIPRNQAISPEGVRKNYDDWATSYDQVYAELDYKAPQFCAETLTETFAAADRSQIRILDVAAGTGLVGEELHKMGFTNMDAVDCSQKMLDEAKVKNIYGRLICDFVGPEQLDMKNDTYDAIVCCGGFATGLLKEDCFPELIRVVKPGGIICIIMRELFLHTLEAYKDKLEPAMARLQQEGLWERASRDVIPDFYPNKSGVRIVFRVL
ncbi:methyltransferase-like protein 27 [Branchiostoma floridae x Branchiostoma japonicum]